MNSKDRAFLRGIAMNISPLVQIGKNGISDNTIQEINDILEARELVKITILNNADYDAKSIINELAEATSSTPIETKGNKIVLYRVSNKKGIKHLI